MTSNDYKKMAEMLEDLSSQYAKAANSILKQAPGEFHRLMNLSDYATILAEDLTQVYWRKAGEELEDEFGG